MIKERKINDYNLLNLTILKNCHSEEHCDEESRLLLVKLLDSFLMLRMIRQHFITLYNKIVKLKNLNFFRAFSLVSILSLFYFSFSSFSFSLSMEEYWKYDNVYPLNPQLTVEKEEAEYTIYKLYYSSIRNKTVSALFLVPKGISECPAVIYIHGAMGNKNDIISLAPFMSSKGYCVLSIDMPYHGERKVEGRFIYNKYPYWVRNGFEQGITDLMRGIDFLESRNEVIKSKIGLLGGSMGGILGAVLFSIDKRISSAVLVVGGGDWGLLTKGSIISEYFEIKGNVDPEDMREAMITCEPLNFAAKASPRPVLMLNALYDVLVPPASNKLLFSSFKPPKKMVWFKTDHNIKPDLIKDMIFKWFDDTLGKTVEPFSIVDCHNCKAPTTEVEVKYVPKEDIQIKDYFKIDANYPLEPKWGEKNGTLSVKFVDMDDFEKEAIVITPEKMKEGFYIIESRNKKELIQYLREKGKGVAFFDDDFHSQISQYTSYPYYFREEFRRRIRLYFFLIRAVKEKFGVNLPIFFIGEDEGNSIGSILSLFIDFEKIIMGKDTTTEGLCGCVSGKLKQVFEPFYNIYISEDKLECYNNGGIVSYFPLTSVQECVSNSKKKDLKEIIK